MCRFFSLFYRTSEKAPLVSVCLSVCMQVRRVSVLVPRRGTLGENRERGHFWAPVQLVLYLSRRYLRSSLSSKGGKPVSVFVNSRIKMVDNFLKYVYDRPIN